MFIPYQADVPMDRKPWANWVLIAAALAAFVGLQTGLIRLEEHERKLSLAEQRSRLRGP